MFDHNLFIKRYSKHKHRNTSFIKNEIAKRLLKRLDFLKISPENILITGYLDEATFELVKKRFLDANIHTHDDENIAFDLIISNSTIHLTADITEELDNYFEMLNENGILLFSTFGDKCFATLRECFSQIDNLPHTNGMITAMDWGAALQTSRYKTPAIESDIINFTYEKVSTLFEDIRELNEPLADTKMQTSLTGKNKWLKFINILEQTPKIEIEALYGYAVKEQDKQEKVKNDDSSRVSLDELKKQIAEFRKN